MISFLEMYKMLEDKGPGRAISSRGTKYKIEARNDSIIAFLESGKGRIYIHDDCWRKSHTCKGTWAGGIYNGCYSIFDWYEEKTDGEINDNGKSRNIVNTTKAEKPKNENARQKLIQGWLFCLNEFFKKAEKEHKDYKEISAREILKKAEEMKVFDDETEFHRRTRAITNAMKSIKEDMDEVTYDNLNSLDYAIRYKLPRIEPIEIENTTDTKGKQKSNNKPNSPILIKEPVSEDKIQRAKQPYDIAQRVKEIILKINKMCKLHNKRHIFDQAALFELWGDIENSCRSENDFKNFTGNLYKLLREKTRYDNPNKKTKDDPKYIFLLPKNFIKIDTPTRHFWDIVNTFRHYYIHDTVGKIADVYEELLGKNKKSGPETPEDYMKLQIEVLKQFDDSMEKLLEMVKDDLNRP